MSDMRSQAITGVVPPQIDEALIAVRWPSLAATAAGQLGARIQLLARSLLRFTMALPLVLSALLIVPMTVLCLLIALPGWLLMAPFFALRILPGTATRYALSNRRLMVQKDKLKFMGIPVPAARLAAVQEVKLDQIRTVRVVPGSEQEFFLSADLEILDESGKPLLVLKAVPEYETFKLNIEDAYKAWARPQPKEQAFPAN